MTAFDDIMESAFGTLLANQGLSGTYTALDGTETAVKIISEKSDSDEESGNSGRTRARRMLASLGRDPNAYGVANPAENETITIDGVVWTITDVGDQDGAVTHLNLSSKAAIEVSRPDYRGR
jgi:hypothetical protein